MTDKGGKVYNIEHYIHGNHIELVLVRSSSGTAGPSIRRFYEKGIGLPAYRRDFGLNWSRRCSSRSLCPIFQFTRADIAVTIV